MRIMITILGRGNRKAEVTAESPEDAAAILNALMGETRVGRRGRRPGRPRGTGRGPGRPRGSRTAARAGVRRGRRPGRPRGTGRRRTAAQAEGAMGQ